MKVERIHVTLFKVELKQGVGKTSKQPYSFFEATILDEDANKMRMILAHSVEVDGQIPEDVVNADRVEAFVDIEFEPRGFGLSGTITAVELK